MESDNHPTTRSPSPQPVVLDETCTALDSFDPMKLDFFNPKFNSYDGVEPAPGIQAQYSISKALLRLFVDRIPPSLDETGLKNLFSKYGTVLDSRIFRRYARDTRCGVVAYGSRDEASKAIDEIHEMEPLFLRVFFYKNFKDDPPTEEEIEAEKRYLKREQLMKEFEENLGVSWDHVPALAEGPNLRLAGLIEEELQSSPLPWIDPIFRDSDTPSHYSLSSKCQFDRKSDYLKAQNKCKEETEAPMEEVVDDDEVYEIGSFFGDPIPFHKISDYIRKRGITSEPSSGASKCPIPSVDLPGGQSSEVFIRIFANGPEIEMFVIKDPFVCKTIRSNLTKALLNEQEESLSIEVPKGPLLAVQLTRDKFWYRSERVGSDRFFLLDFGKYVSVQEVEDSSELPHGFLGEIPSQAIPANFFDDYKFSLEGKALKDVLLLFKNKKIRVQPMGVHKNGQVLLRFEGAKGPNGKDLLDYFLEEGFIHKVSPPLQLGVDYDPLLQLQRNDSKKLPECGSVVFIVDFMDSTDEVILVEQSSIEERKLFQDKLLQKGHYCESLSPSFIVENRIVKYERPEDSTFFRGKILSLDSQRKKVRLFLIDFGFFCLAEFKYLYPLDKDDLSVPSYATVLTLQDVERIFIFDPEVFLKIRRILPILKGPLTIQSISKNGAILRHPNGKTINKIIQDKLVIDDSHFSGTVEGQGRFCAFDYDQCLISELSQSPSLVEVCLLHIESPSEIFATPTHSLPLYSDFLRQVQAYCSIQSEPGFYKPDTNKVYLVKSSSDGSWYRGVNLDTEYNVFFADVGMIEKISPSNVQTIHEKLMKYPFLSNHCVYKGFEGLKIEENEFSFLKDLAYTKVSIRVLEVKDCYFVIDIPSIDEQMTALREKIMKICEE